MARKGNYLGIYNLDTESENLTLQSMMHWTLTGPNAVVKVIGVDDVENLPVVERSRTLKGYVTQARYLNGLNANQIERDLGLQQASMRCGLWIFWLARLPGIDDVAYRFKTNWPDGRPWKKKDSARYWAARDEVKNNPTDRINVYTPGSNRIPQWKILKLTEISGAKRQVTASTPFSI